MKPSLRRTVLVEVIRYMGVTQAGPAVILHGAWMLLALAVWQHATAGSTSSADFTRPLLRAFVWLGGTDGHGVGSASNLVVVFGKISVVLYLIEAMVHRAVGPRAPVRLRVVALASGCISFLGYGLSFLSGAADGIGGLLLLIPSSLAWRRPGLCLRDGRRRWSSRESRQVDRRRRCQLDRTEDEVGWSIASPPSLFACPLSKAVEDRAAPFV